MIKILPFLEELFTHGENIRKMLSGINPQFDFSFQISIKYRSLQLFSIRHADRIFYPCADFVRWLKSQKKVGA